uniref:Fungal-type protein kinase domain-containing protein n=1 Tax=Psilocybe cubensis TaxID=181762 RepID=A0A8H7XX27_PSICU
MSGVSHNGEGKKPLKGVLLSPEALRSYRNSAQLEHIGIVQRRQQHIVREMDSEFKFIRCPVESFMNTYLPFVPNDKETQYFVQQLLQGTLTGAGNASHSSDVTTRPVLSVLTGNETTFAFRDYPLQRKRGRQSNSKITVFRGWEKIAQTIGNIEYPGERKRNKFSYANVPNKRIASSNRGYNNKIDAAFVAACDTHKPLQTTDVAVVVGHKVAASHTRQNALHVVSSNVQIMNEDVRRMFTFGITAERHNVTLWYHDRSHSAASYPFNLSTNPKLFIQVLIAFLFATEEELGYDSMVKLKPDRNYTFKIPSLPGSDKVRFFRTVEGLSLYHSNGITGRMTRVYKVVEVRENGEAFGDPLVLKDVWLDSSAKTEKEIQNAIFTDIKQFWDCPDDPPELKGFKESHKNIVGDDSYKQYFLQIVLDYSGQKTKVRVERGTEVRGFFDAEQDLALDAPVTGTASQGSQSMNDQTFVNTQRIVSQPPALPAIPSEQKRQYRILFKEICRPSGRLETLGEVVNVLSQTLIPLQLLFLRGMESKGPWLAKLSDLEYAKKFSLPKGTAPAADQKTGTPYFMPLELMMSSYLFSAEFINAIIEAPLDPAKNTIKTEQKRINAERLAQFKQKLQMSTTAKKATGVVHNFQYDLESIWWILLWNICCRLHPEHSTQSLQDFGKAIFVNEMKPTDSRMRCITEPSIGESIVAEAPESLFPLVSALFLLRHDLYQHYVDRGKRETYDDIRSYSKIHNIFFYIFKLLNKEVTEASEPQNPDDDEGDSHWSKIPLLVKERIRNSGAEGSAVGEPERKRPRSNEDHVDAREVESEGRTGAKQSRKK